MGSSERRPAGGAAPGRTAARRPGGTVRDSRGHGRETIESVVVAFTLALIFKAFEAEAFVIPTGSMAPTLMGRHKDLVCESCGTAFRVGCSSEVDDDAASLRTELARLEQERAAVHRTAVNASAAAGEREAARRRLELLENNPGPIAERQDRLLKKMVPRASCPNCGAVTELMEDAPGGSPAYKWDYPSFNGDRIIVDKITYDFRDPARWDVVVFKFPEDARINYIKRLVGLPGETVTIAAGDVWIARGTEPPTIARKPADTLVGMLQCVHDSRHRAADLAQGGWPAAWSDWSPAAAACRWTTPDDGRSFSAACGADESAELRFRRFVPAPEELAAITAGGPLAAPVEPVLVGDFQAYNHAPTGRPQSSQALGAMVDGDHWVGDLALEVDLESQSTAGRVTLDLVEAGVVHACSIDLADGTATLARSTPGQGVEATARTAVRGRGRWRLLFANVDDELALFVDGRRMHCSGPTTWTRGVAEAIAARPVLTGARPGDADRGDLAPAGVTARGADVRIDRLRVLRDVYYIAMKSNPPIMRDRVSFAMAPDQFLMLGDNSAASSDSRLWQSGHHVDRRLIVGRALVVFWPHGVPTTWSIPLKIGTWELRLPFLPNFARMRFVR